MDDAARGRQCARCGAEPTAGARFCTGCGEPLAARVGGAGGRPGDAGEDPWAPVRGPAGARLVHCPACDGANAASRPFCGRCGVALRPGAEQGALVLPDPALRERAGAAGGAPAEPREGGVPATLLVVTVLAALAIIGVLLTILSARGVGLFAGPGVPPTPGAPVPVEPAAARASSMVPPSGDVTYGPENLLDGDETTAWKEGAASDGTGEWVELRFDREIAVSRLLVWNGDQRPGRFAEHNRVASARLEVGDRAFTADLLDVEGPQAVDLPEPVLADRVRVVVLDVHAGDRYEDTALSRLEVHVRPAPDG